MSLLPRLQGPGATNYTNLSQHMKHQPTSAGAKRRGARKKFLSFLACEQALHMGESREVTRVLHAKGDANARGGGKEVPPLPLAALPLAEAFSRELAHGLPPFVPSSHTPFDT